MIDYKKFTKEVHDNAVQHGWWDDERSVDEIICLIHSEWSEALEEYRAGRPMVWCRCGHISLDKVCDCGNGGCNLYDTDDCKRMRGKPEGIAVELIDGCIRILDWFGKLDYSIEWMYPLHFTSFPTLICELHDACSIARECINDESRCGGRDEALSILAVAFWTAFGWIEDQGLNPEALMLEKHEYNKHRPYKHGGKKI